MDTVTVRVLGVDQWREYRDVRLAALKDSPHAFSSSLDEELTHDEQQWRACMVRAHRLQAERDGAPVGVVSVGPTADEEGSADVFGLWVDSAARNTGVAWGLVEAACDQALKSGWEHLYYWVGYPERASYRFRQQLRLPAHVAPTDGTYPMCGLRGAPGDRDGALAAEQCGCAEPDGTAADQPARPGRGMVCPDPAGQERTAARRCPVRGVVAGRSWVEGKKIL